MIFPEKDVNILDVKREYNEEEIIYFHDNVFAYPTSPVTP